MLDGNDLIAIAIESKASHAALLDTSTIKFYEAVRKACEKNVCGKFDTNWMGPPAIGPISVLQQRVTNYRQGLLFQTLHSLSSNFNWKGMMECAKHHYNVFQELLGKIRAKYPGEDILPLNAGCCSVCEKCAYLDKEPCRHPDQAASSVEAYGMTVIELQKSVGLPYYGGKNSLIFVGMILFNKQ